ncbi:glycosyltransferase family 87 protein [Sphingomonas sp.]|uniref:glycosyltransferase family 87 protein n=1 Tax=Sphingomonas sp. TaxID=28214 RepID=UPI00286C340C|nr:glycosyltransferase family 87 protein [Sphingomonas sp.]
MKQSPASTWVHQFLLLPATVFPVLLMLACWTSFTNPPPIDFFSFWTGAQLVLAGNAAQAYQSQMSGFGLLMPLAYPPPFLLLIAPFGLISFGSAFAVWSIATGGLYLAATGSPRRAALACPPAAANALVGQNGFLTTAILLIGLRQLTQHPWLVGAIFGLMVIKPQLAMLLPLALVAGGHWKALIGAAASASCLIALAFFVFGFGAYQGFADVLLRYSSLLQDGRWPWNELASSYALVRWSGAGHGVALSVHIGIASIAALIVWTAWRNDWACKVPVFAAATLLISPYLFTYDAVLLAAPLAWLTMRKPGWAMVVWCLALVPLLRNVGYPGPNAIPLAVIAALVAMILPDRDGATAGTASDPV